MSGTTKRALVTGASGFIGRHMTATLRAVGYDVHAIDTVESPGVKRGDARYFFAFDLGIGQKFDVVIHAAAHVGGRGVIENSPLDQAVNLELDAALFRWARRCKPGRVVYFSSSAAYPVIYQDDDAAVGMKLRESDIMPGCPQQPDSLYGWIKLTGERLAALYAAEGGAVSVVRPFSGYGEDQGLDYPWPAIAARARAHEDPLIVWGSGSQVRDWIHVDDICAALMVMIDQGIPGPVNLGTGRGTSMTELAGYMAQIAGYCPRVVPLADKPAGVMYRVADVTVMREFYEPKVTLIEGVARMLSEREAA